MISPEELDPILMHPKRLSIVTLLYVLGPRRMSDLVKYLNISWGDLSSHVKKLEEAGYVERVRVFTSLGEKVIIRLTKDGIVAFLSLVEKLRKLTESLPEKPKIEGIEGFRIK